MRREVTAFGEHYTKFVERLDAKELLKLKYLLTLLETRDRIPEKYIKYIRDGLYELRLEYGGNIYRLFFIFDRDSIVVLFNGFQKKTRKTPENEIVKALRIKEEYLLWRRKSLS